MFCTPMTLRESKKAKVYHYLKKKLGSCVFSVDGMLFYNITAVECQTFGSSEDDESRSMVQIYVLMYTHPPTSNMSSKRCMKMRKLLEYLLRDPGRRSQKT